MRTTLKRLLASAASRRPGRGASLLIYHRVGGGSPDERDVMTSRFVEQLDVLRRHDVVSLDEALDRAEAGDDSPVVVLTFDDGFADVYENAWPHLRARELAFTLYLASGMIGSVMSWDGSTARSSGPALSWDQVREMSASGLCTLGNHTDTHVRPALLDAGELDRCQDAVFAHTGVRPRHFAFPWGVAVPAMRRELADRFRSSVTGEVGRVLPGADRLALPRIPVRASDPTAFFAAKLSGALVPERVYGSAVRLAKVAGARA